MDMCFTWDEQKNKSNLIKDGVRFEQANTIFDGNIYTAVDQRRDYGEVREISIGETTEGLVLVVVHTSRRGSKRIISARVASSKERSTYHERIKKNQSG